MAAARILFVKLSSLGDVVHHLPAVTDLARHLPGVHVAWALEEAYVPLARLHPAVAETIPVGLRGLRSRPHEARSWRLAAQARRHLRTGHWDYVIDTQGLMKSALVASFARGPRFGLDSASARERLAARFYDVGIPVPRAMHAVERNRRVVAEVFGYAVDHPADYGLAIPPRPPQWAPEGPYAVLLHAASREAKQWPRERWVELARRFAEQGGAAVFPGGTPREREAAAELARQIPGSLAAPPMDLAAAAALLAHASCVVGVDTGLTHLAVALDRPTVGIYRATDPALTGLHGASGTNLGAPGREVAVGDVLRALGLE